MNEGGSEVVRRAKGRHITGLNRLLLALWLFWVLLLLVALGSKTVGYHSTTGHFWLATADDLESQRRLDELGVPTRPGVRLPTMSIQGALFQVALWGGAAPLAGFFVIRGIVIPVLGWVNRGIKADQA
jgi:hypothetical protein